MAAVSKSTDWLMVAMTPFAISFLMTSMGLFSIFCARSRMIIVLGSSMLVLIDHLRITDLRNRCPPGHGNAWRWSVSERVMRSHGLLAGLRFRERIHKGHQTFTIGSGEVHLEGMREAAFQASLPAGTAVVQICAASSQLARRIYQHSIRTAD